MSILIEPDAMERIGVFIDKYVRLPDGSSVPRDQKFYKAAFQMMLKSGAFKSVRDIKIACLLDQSQMIPTFLLENSYKTLDKRENL
ncbi:MAG: hypothetical protein IKG47_00685 [Oscillospiraceae bacterium]|nr:hypothetical protein [Oscillospiraceae bacterium]